MAIYAGAKEMIDGKVGSKNIQEVWLGNTKVWPTFKLGTWTSFSINVPNAYAYWFTRYQDGEVMAYGGGVSSSSVTSMWGKVSFAGSSPVGSWVGTSNLTLYTEIGAAQYSGARYYLFGGKPDTSVNANEVTNITEYSALQSSLVLQATATYTAQGAEGAQGNYNDTSYNANIEVFGGYHSGFLASHVSYQPNSGLLTYRASLPVAMNGHQAVANADNSLIYLIGGNTSSGKIATTRTYNPLTYAYTTRANMPTATAFGRAILSKDGKKIYYVGGENSSGTTNAMYEYNIAQDKWYTQTGMPVVRRKHGIYVHSDGTIYVTAGRNSSTGVDTVIYKFTP
jgi:hypothetical protein